MAASIDKKTQTDKVIFDFSKAFDRVPHQRLVKKNHHYGIHGNSYHWIASFFNKRTQPVLLEGQSSEKVTVVDGVTQGSVFRPVLFFIFINDLPDNFNSKVRVFTDDCIVYREIKSIQDHHVLQEVLATLVAWERTWGNGPSSSKL